MDGKRVGLLTHPAGKNARGEQTVDVFVRSSNVNLVALFGPEHGIYGDEKASVPVDDKIDQKQVFQFFLYMVSSVDQTKKCYPKLTV